MCTDLGPNLQREQHASILPGLLEVMADFSQPRVQAHAAAAVVNFSENCEQVFAPMDFDKHGGVALAIAETSDWHS